MLPQKVLQLRRSAMCPHCPRHFAPPELVRSVVQQFYKHFVRAPSKAGCFLLGESPSRVKTNQLLVPSVAAVRRRSQGPNETVEAYTGNHAGRKGDRSP